ncbi:beta-N-acetylhexosaminidase [Petroclostridium sp. X23]|uniref:beta-N-acetylhexosaminidase n=1 Tax=Petroclostridium sp. X23 TaxID=3045146 RepID=UPI0024AC910E|nr:beta-N-acetylhexosaminidase [Petroclostridium sp. X23]WHH58765.1 beta-N-acetylhexosaminidase [Petroclostridium sp. X23]
MKSLTKKMNIALLVMMFFIWYIMGGGSLGAYVQAASDIDTDGSSQIEKIMKNMTLEEKIGQMFMLDFRKKDGQDITSLDESIVNAIKKYKPGGVILFRENTVGTLQTLELTSAYQKATPKIPLFIAADQEGGAVTRLQSGTTMPGNMALGAAHSSKLAYAVAKATGEELKAVGINMNFAPVVDVNNNPSNPVIGIRSFGDDPEEVAKMGIAFMKGLNDVGVIAAAKHFPGHGDTAMDSHIALPTVPHGIERLEKIELKPFQEIIDNGIDMIMTAHVTFPAIDNGERTPATLSYPCLTGLLREKMGFKGVIITDAFSMKAITDRYGDKEAAAMAIKAGADIVLMPQDLENTFPYILDQVKNGEISEQRIDSSVEKILSLKIKRGIISNETGNNADSNQAALDMVGGTANEFIKKIAAETAVTLVKNDNSNLPFKLKEGSDVVFFAPSQIGANKVQEVLENLVQSTGIKKVSVHGFNYDGEKMMIEEQKNALKHSTFVLLFTRSVKVADMSPDSSFMPVFASEVVKYTDLYGKKLAAIAVRNPYDIQFLNDVKSYIAAYTDWQGGGVEAALKTVFGIINPVGKLPVTLPDGKGEILYRNGHGMSYNIENMDNEDRNQAYDSYLPELWEKGLIDDAGAFKYDPPVEGQKLADLLKKILLVTTGQTLELETSQGTLNRYQMIHLFVKAAEAAGIDHKISTFDDINQKIPEAYRDDVKRALEFGLIIGYPDGSINGDDKATHSQMVTAAERFLKLIEKSDILLKS